MVKNNQGRRSISTLADSVSKVSEQVGKSKEKLFKICQKNNIDF